MGADVTGAIGTYNPNGTAAVMAFIAFGVAALCMWYRFFQTHPRPTWTLWLVTANSLMALGYIIRFSRRNGISAWAFLFETCFILISPCSYLAYQYMILPRLSRHLEAPDCLAFSEKWVVRFFVMGDIVTILAQLAGTALQATFGDLIKIGVKVAAIGLWVQMIFFGGYIYLLVTFGVRLHKRVQHHGKWQGDSVYLSGAGRTKDWRSLYIVVAISNGLLLIRSIYRAAEYTAGAGSSLGDSEVAFYILDTVPMFLVSVLLAMVWAPHCLRERVDAEEEMSWRSPDQRSRK